MKKLFVTSLLIGCLGTGAVMAQDLKAKDVPDVVKTALAKKYPAATKVSWEKENGNFEANWGGRSGEDNSAQFSPAGVFVEYEMAIAVSDLPAAVAGYVKKHYNGASIKEAGKITSANGTVTYEAEVKGKDVIFDANGAFVKESEGD